MNEAELAQCHAVLGVQPGVTAEELQRAHMSKSFALIRAGGTAAEREQLRTAYEALLAHVQAPQPDQQGTPAPPTAAAPPWQSPRPVPLPVSGPGRPGVFPLFAFNNWWVNVIAPLLVAGLAWLANLSPFGFFLEGFHVWIHELGHASAAWMTGRRALPLPLGWTPIEPPFSLFVYFGILLLLGLLFYAGWRERKVWAMIIAVALAALQFYMTWRLPRWRQEFLWTFCGVGGEFYVAALFMACFFVELPEKFKWGACRYVFLFIGAGSFLKTFLFWRQVWHGLEDIPMGTMVNGEDDAGGDMNVLMDEYKWRRFDIRLAYHHMGNWCLAALVIIYLVFALRLNLIADRLIKKWKEGETRW